MIARGAERNLSCFRPEGLLDPTTIVAPLYLRVVRPSSPSPPRRLTNPKQAFATDNHYSNTKYCLTSMAAAPSRRGAMKQELNKAKSYEDACAVYGVDFVELGQAKVEDLLPAWAARKRVLEGGAEVVVVVAEGEVSKDEGPKAVQ